MTEISNDEFAFYRVFCRNLLYVPNGAKDNKGNISLYFKLQSEAAKDFTVDYKLGIYSKTGRALYVRKGSCLGHQLDIGRGFPKFITHDDLFNNPDLLPNNELTLMCNVN